MIGTTSSSDSPRSARIERRVPLSAAHTLRVLLAEDNKVNQQFATLVLNQGGHSVEVAANGRLAVEALVRSDFDVVLMDIQMPELDGVQATRLIRALPEPKGRIPIIAVTAHAMSGAREQYLADGMDDYISKPYKSATLLSMLAKISASRTVPLPIDAPEKASEEPVIRVDELPVLDLEQLATLGSVFTLPKIRNLASLYILDVEARLLLLAQCRAKDDFDGVSRQAHMIVSTAGNLGAKHTSAVAHMLEVSCISQDDARSDELIAKVRASCAQSLRALDKWLKDEPGLVVVAKAKAG